MAGPGLLPKLSGVGLVPVHGVWDALEATASLALVKQRASGAQKASITKHGLPTALDNHTDLTAANASISLFSHYQLPILESEKGPTIGAAANASSAPFADDLNAALAKASRRCLWNDTAWKVRNVIRRIIFKTYRAREGHRDGRET